MIPPLAALFSWPIVSIILFQKQSLRYAIAITIVAGYLLLPEVYYFNLPLLPTLDKHSIPAIVVCCLALGFAASSDGRAGFMPKGVLPVVLLTGFVLGGFLTTITNMDPIQVGPRVLAGLQLYDSFSVVLGAMITILPMLIARKFLSDTQGHRTILIVFMIAALAYSPLAWIELRMSPQMNNWVYGFFPHSWVQHIRANGYRPVVFLEHGLRLSIFLCAALLATVALFRVMQDKRSQLLMAVGFLLLTLVFSKSLGALLIAIALLPIVFLLGTRTQLMAATVLGGLVLIYPMARATDLIPVDAIQQTIAQYSPDRAASLGARLDNEQALLDRAALRPVFGWGGWGRSRIVNEQGEDITIADGYWIIAFGVGGWTRYISEFGLMVFPIIFMFVRSRSLGIRPETAALSLIMVANLIDMIPNSSMTPLTWLAAGALWGRLEAPEGQPAQVAGSASVRNRNRSARREEPPETEEVMADRRETRYTRQKTRIDRIGS